MKGCPHDLIEALADDRLGEEDSLRLSNHLTRCGDCRTRLNEQTASDPWWSDVARLLDNSLLDDPDADVADSSAADTRLFEGDDPIGELQAAGVIESANHPEMLGQLGRYALEREIGSGGMGVVFKGYDAELNRTVAIKVLAPHLARSGAARERFVREGRAAAAVVHENVVAIHEVDTSGKLPTLVMNCVDGVSLQRHVDTIGPLPVSDALRIAAQTAGGLAAAHRQGIIHRDVKPANILVGGGGQRIWITDFGLARAVDDASLTRTGFIAGTPHYMSPEQARGGNVGPSSDLFSLGSVLYFMLAGRPPWRAERSLAVLHRIVQHQHRSLREINSDVPREVSDLVDRLLTKEVTQRPSEASQVQIELEHLLSKRQNPDSPHSPEGTASESSAQQSPQALRRRVWERPVFLVPTTAILTALMIQAASFVRTQMTSSKATPPFIAKMDTDANTEYEKAWVPAEAASGRDFGYATTGEAADDLAMPMSDPRIAISEANQSPVPIPTIFDRTENNSLPKNAFTFDNWGNPVNEAGQIVDRDGRVLSPQEEYDRTYGSTPARGPGDLMEFPESQSQNPPTDASPWQIPNPIPNQTPLPVSNQAEQKTPLGSIANDVSENIAETENLLDQLEAGFQGSTSGSPISSAGPGMQLPTESFRLQ